MVHVSVVIPTYNREHTIQRAVSSALNQSLDNIEVIVVDDGSTDNTERIVKEFDDDRLSYIRHDHNKGGSAARNTGISHASGEYIAFLDSDDEWLPRKLELQYQRMNELKSSDWIGCYCDFRQKRSNRFVEFVDNKIRRPTGLEGDYEIIGQILLRKFAHGGASSLIVNRETVESVDGFDESFERHQDLEFLVRLLGVGKLASVDEVLLYKFDTGYPSTETVRTAMNQFNKKFKDLIECRNLTKEVHQVQRFMIAKYNFREGDFRTGIRNLRHGSSPHYRDAIALIPAIVSGMKGRMRTQEPKLKRFTP